MKKILKKIADFFKFVWEKGKGFVFIIIGAVTLFVIGKKIIARLGKVKIKKNWAVIDETTIAITDSKGKQKEIVNLPKDPKTGKQIKSKDLKAVGIAEGDKNEITVEIKHTATNRRGSKSSNK